MLPALRRAFSPPALAPPPAPAPPYLSRPPAASARPSPSRCHAPLTTARRCSYPVSQRESTRRRVAASVTPSQPPPEAASPRIRPSAPEPAIEARQASDAALDAAAPSRGAAASWAAPLAGVEVVGADGARVALTGLWATRRVVVAWTRHFGCLLCRKRATMLANEKDAFEAAGVTLIVIGPGSDQHAKQFLEQTNFPGEVYADRQRASYEALQFVAGLSTVFTPTAALSVAKARLEGFKQDWGQSMQPDTVLRSAWQQGGMIVAGPGVDNLLFLHKDKEAGDEPDVHDIIAAARQPLP
ncbi:hypothetical protein CLOP_g22436 [Closterium sp. NIES-67]|nr:hypothetical protein CLOP_g22436 [Closterium sp. NIES-67]